MTPENPWNVSEAAVQIIEQLAPFRPAELFCQVLIDEVNSSQQLLSRPPPGTRPTVELTATHEWIVERLHSVVRIGADYITWVESDFLAFFSRKDESRAGVSDTASILLMPPDTATENIPTIIAISRKLGSLYRQAIEWSHSVRNADVHPVFREFTYELSFYADGILRAIERIGPELSERISATGAAVKPGAVVKAGEQLLLAPKMPDLTPFIEKYTRLCESLQSGVSTEDSIPGKAGYLYILTNRSLGNMIKVGKTKRSPRDRINELSAATAIPTPFALAFDAYVEDCDKAEAYVHARLERDGYRVARNREFFNVDVSTAIAVILEAQRTVSAPGRQQSGQKTGGC